MHLYHMQQNFRFCHRQIHIFARLVVLNAHNEVAHNKTRETLNRL